MGNKWFMNLNVVEEKNLVDNDILLKTLGYLIICISVFV